MYLYHSNYIIPFKKKYCLKRQCWQKRIRIYGINIVMTTMKSNRFLFFFRLNTFDNLSDGCGVMRMSDCQVDDQFLAFVVITKIIILRVSNNYFSILLRFRIIYLMSAIPKKFNLFIGPNFIVVFSCKYHVAQE